MAALADTNILLRVLQRGDPNHEIIRAALRKLKLQGESIHYISQNLVEFWRVCTRPKSANGLGMTIPESDHWAKVVERIFRLAPDRPEVHEEWRRMVVVHRVSGVQVHDARIVAAMRVNGITDLLTLNVADFRRYPGITAIHPRDV
jgi:predicted nucleic acid-binding protein